MKKSTNIILTIMKSKDIDYKIFGDDLQCVEIELDQEESVIAEAGSMMTMEENIRMNTIFGDGSNQNKGVLGKLFSAGKRVLTGESLFMTAFSNQGAGKARVTFAASFPGQIIPMKLSEHENRLICQKDAFLCAAKGVSVGIEFQRRLGVGFFGGEGFIMQKLEGDGLTFLHAGGTVIKRDLAVNEQIYVDTGCLVAFSKSVDFNIRLMKGVRNTLFGGEGLFLATLKGPGSVWLQSMPLSRLANHIYRHAPANGGSRKGEGSILGGIGDLLGGRTP